MGIHLTDDMRAALDVSVLCWLATVDEQGCPNVTPKEAFSHDGDAIVIAHIASPGSVANIRRHPLVCVTVLDVFEQRGFKFKGTAEVVDSTDPMFDTVARRVMPMLADRFPLHGVIKVEVDVATPVVAPSIWLHPDIPAAERRAATLATYGVDIIES